jgi:hypothetical protein
MEIPKNQESLLEFVELGTIEDGILAMPTLYSMNARDKYLVWTIYIGIVDHKGNKINVNEEYIDREDLPEGAKGIYWTISGTEDGKQTESERTYISKGKYTGKKNFTTPFTQAVIDAKSIYQRKIKKGYKLDKDKLKRKDEPNSFEELYEDSSRGQYPWRVYAMAIHDYKKHKEKIHFPATVQPKYDGTLFIVVYHPLLPTKNINDVKMKIDGYSRSKESYEKQNHILEEIYPAAKEYPGLHFVGELWKEGYGLQEISGMTRRKADSKLSNDVLYDFNIFDCFYIEDKDQEFVDRQYILDEALTKLKNPNYIKVVPTTEVQNEKELMKKYKEFLDKNYEGAVVRNYSALYEYGVNKENRSYQTLKLKPRPDAEWPIVGFTEGKGKEAGSVIWICADKNSEDEIRDRKTFHVTPNLCAEARKYIFEKLTKDPKFFEDNILGQLAVISYSILSDIGFPQQPKMLRFRDENIDKLLVS